MDCSEARRKADQDAPARQHVATCPVCLAVTEHPGVERQLASTSAFAVDGGELATQLLRLQGALTDDASLHGWLRARPRTWVVGVAAAWTLGTLGFVGIKMPRPDWSTGLLVAAIGVAAALVLPLTVGLARVVSTPFAPTPSRGWVAVIGFFALLMPLASATHWPAAEVSAFDGEFFSGVGRCFRFGASLTVPLMAWMQLTRRGGPSLATNRFVGAALLAWVGILSLELHCPNLELAHRLLGHASLALACGLGGLLVRRS